MPPKKQPTIWPALPHTIAKIDILKNYLLAWFPIFGRKQRGQDLLYVDGFAGPGEYTNYSAGSPIAALVAATATLSQTASAWIAGDIHCAFIEPDRKRFSNLKERVEPFQNIRKLRIHLYNCSFVVGLNQLRVELPDAFLGSQPLFIFIDPFGATGVPFSEVAAILSSTRSEVLINFDADGVARIFQAGEQSNREALLDVIFPEGSWRSLSSEQPFSQLCRQVLSLYITGLRKLPNVKYVFAFEMQAKTGAVNYFLVFASQHPRGLEKMKEAMKKIDQAGDYKFSDARVGQGIMFRFDNPGDFAPLLYEEFNGRRILYSKLHDFALTETPFLNPKAMLKILEEQGKINVDSTDPKRRKGTFNEERIQYIEFLKGEHDG